jgi:cell division protein FtsB
MVTFVFAVFAFVAGVFIGYKYGAKAVAEVEEAKAKLEADLATLKNNVEAKVDEIKSRF